MTGTGMELPALEGLVAAIRLVLEGIGIPKARRKQWFEQHIEPSYKLLIEIHREYMSKFQEASKLLKTRKNVEKVISLLREERPRKLLERTEAAALIRSLSNAAIKKKPFPRSKREPTETRQLFDMYVFSYEKYLNSASPVDPDAGTYYSYFISTLQTAFERGRDPYKEDFSGRAQRETLIDDVAEILERAVNDVMPDAFSEVQKRYMDLRAYCLDAGL